MQIEDDRSREEGKQFLTFKVGKELFGIGIGYVREVIEKSFFTAVPRTPKYVKGIINLRGDVVPVIDFPSLLFGHSNEMTRFTCIAILDLEDEGETSIIGILIDAVSEVISIKPENIESAPDFGINIRHDYISGVAKINDRLVLLLDVLKVLDIEDLSDFGKVRAYKSESPLKAGN